MQGQNGKNPGRAGRRIKLILMADTCGLDMDEIIQEKVRKNGEKYPVEKAYGHKEKYTELGK